MAELRQYPTDQEIKESYDAYLKGEQALAEFIRAQRTKRAAEKIDASEGSCMTDTKNDEDQWLGSPYVVYRRLQDDPIRSACEEAARQLRAEGKPLFLETKKNLK